MCEWGNEKKMWVRIPASYSHTGHVRWKRMGIDACIEPIIKALRRARIVTIYSCCGHGKGDGLILLEDGRAIVLTTLKKLEDADEKAILLG
jgi:hypothetical protein